MTRAELERRVAEAIDPGESECLHNAGDYRAAASAAIRVVLEAAAEMAGDEARALKEGFVYEDERPHQGATDVEDRIRRAITAKSGDEL